ncbi:MAG: hypothetical protein GY733_14465 [bacterium]|nr:hypothetical protein [bacterium]
MSSRLSRVEVAHLLARLGHYFDKIDWFLPECLDRNCAEQVRRARMTVAIGFFGSLTVAVSPLVTAQTPPVAVRVVSITLGFFLFASPFLLRASRRPQLVRHALVASMFMVALGLSASSGGADSGSAFLAILLPFFAILLCGARDGALWSLVTVASFAAVATAAHHGYEPPVRLDPAATVAWNQWGAIGGMFVSLGIALAYEWLRNLASRDLAAARARADLAHAQQLETQMQFRTQLEALIEERTQELLDSREQLRRADRLASVGTLAAGVGHQINNPVGSILLGAQFALEQSASPDRERIYREALEVNAEHAQRCGRIVHNLLSFARNDPTEKFPLDLNDLVCQSLAVLPEPMERFDVELCEGPLMVLASGIEIEQVIVNLVRNALQADRCDTSPVGIRTERTDLHAVIHVTDEGQGIKEDDRERIFDPFFTTRLSEGGSGLGLSLVHSIVEDHVGRVDVRTEVGIGTDFIVSLPLAPVAPSPI